MRKVVNSKPVPESLGTSAKKNSAKFLCLLIVFVMLMVGCNPRKVNASATLSPTPQEIMQVVSNGENVPELPADTPVITESPIPEETPFSSPYFVFNPTEDELKKLEKAANEYGERLESNYDGEVKFEKEDEEYFKLAKNLCGYFDNLDLNSCKNEEEVENAKNEVYKYMCRHWEAFTVIAMSPIISTPNGEKRDMNFCDIETEKVFDSIENGNYIGTQALELLENNLYNIQKAVLAENKEEVEKNGRDLVDILKLIFLSNGGMYKGKEIAALKDMYPSIQLAVKRIGFISIVLVSGSLKSDNINMGDSSVYNMDILYRITAKETDTQKTEPQIKEAIFALMDAYIYLVKSGQLTVVGTSESPQLIYTPSPKPE